MTFEHPIWLVLTPLVVLISIGLVALGWRKRSHLLGRFVANRLLEQLTEKASLQRRLVKSLLIVAAFGVLGLALARPQYGVEWSERKARGLDIVFVLDCSKSMLASDLRPNRLERARLAILDLVDRLGSDRIGLVGVAGEAFLQTPPTLDYGTFRQSLRVIDPAMFSLEGSDLARGIEEASEAFPSANNVKVVVLLSDGEDAGNRAVEAARDAAERGIQIFVIGVGTPEGQFLRTRNETGEEVFVRDERGQPIRSRLQEPTLQAIAQAAGGSYTRLGGGSLDAFYGSVLATLPREERESELVEVPVERFQWLLAAALLCLILEILLRNRRPGATPASVLLIGLLMASPHTAEAHTQAFNDAHSALIAGDYARANQLYTEAMQQTDDRSLQLDALYNMGHATHQIGRAAYEAGELETALEEIRSAEALFESALELGPDDSAIQQDIARIRAVREAIEELLEQQEQQQQDTQESGEPDSEPSESPDSQDAEPAPDESAAEEESDPAQQDPSDASESAQQDPQQEDGAEDSQTREGEPDPDSEAAEEAPPEEETTRSQTDEGEAEESDASTRPDETEQPADEAEAADASPESAESETAEAADENGEAAEGETQPAVEVMTLEEAQELLDSQRGNERILPFTQPSPRRNQPF